MLRSLWIIVLVALVMAKGPRASQGWQDPSPHRVSFVTVEPQVRLEVLDWRGRGEPVLLLPGHGDTAHVFDDFAPRLEAAGLRVLRLTRRGFGASSQPERGYDLASLTSDILRVIDERRLGLVHLVGHSISATK